MPEYKYVFASVTGSGHSQCQDISRALQIGDSFLAVISDGCGSAKCATQAAQLTVDLCFKHLIEEQGEIEDLLTRLSERLKEIAVGADISDYSATLLLYYFDGNISHTLQVGDGSVAVKMNDTWTICPSVSPSVYVNECYYPSQLTESNSSTISTYHQYTGVQAVMMCSDGFERYCIENKSGVSQVFTPFIERNFEILKYMQLHQPDMIYSEFEKLLSHGNAEIAAEPDDKSLILAYTDAQ